MKNLKKISLLIAIFSITILLSTLFIDKVLAQSASAPDCFTGCGSPKTKEFFDFLITNNPLNCRTDCGATSNQQSACFSKACVTQSSAPPAKPSAAPPPAAPPASGGQALTLAEKECFDINCGSTRAEFDIFIKNALVCNPGCGATSDEKNACFSKACDEKSSPPATAPPATRLAWKQIVVCSSPTPAVSTAPAVSSAPLTSPAASPTKNGCIMPGTNITVDLLQSTLENVDPKVMNDANKEIWLDRLKTMPDQFTPGSLLWTALVASLQCPSSSGFAPGGQAPAPAPPGGLSDCPINQTGGGITFKCRASNPDPNSCIKQLATTCVNITASTDTCWQCQGPAPTSAPISACSPSDCSGLCAVGSSCQQVAGTFTKSCSCQSSTTASTTTPAQATTTLAVTLNAQDTALTAETLPVTLSLFNLSTNTLVQGAPATSTFNKTPIPGRQFAANIPISGLLQNKFFLLIRKDNLIARTFFTIDSSGSITVPTTTLVFGDINTDNDISILDYNILIGCFGKLATAAGCSVSNLDSNGKIDVIDYNTWLKGLATWRKQI